VLFAPTSPPLFLLLLLLLHSFIGCRGSHARCLRARRAQALRRALDHRFLGDGLARVHPFGVDINRGRQVCFILLFYFLLENEEK
jgi:hypothetical protein